ncbi:MAG: hypothetical protein KGI41_01720 [Patescibacteria group bacterium]|nr:hypothetical protein [Patescibacteria group bacterium]MDE1965945.1 hypothetical protein [Patescibacteria group bacterium]
MARHNRRFGKGFFTHLEIYAFWTGFASTVISLAQVIIIALRSGGTGG